MITHLSSALAKYYSRQGRKIIFINGKSLNQVVFDMWNFPESQGVDPSSLSRALSGQRLLTTGQLDTLCKVLKLTKLETQELKTHLEMDYMARTPDWPVDFESKEIDFYQYFVEKISQESISMQWEAGYDLSCQLDWMLMKQQAQIPDTKKELFFDIAAKNIINLAFFAPSALSGWGRDIFFRLQRHSQTLKIAGETLKYKHYNEMSKVIWHPYYYFNHQYAEVEDLADSVKLTEPSHMKWDVDLTHSQIVAWGGQKKFTYLNQFGSQLTSKNPIYRDDDKVKLLVALSKAYFSCGNYKDADQYLDTAWNTYYSTNDFQGYGQMRFAQLAVTTLRFKIERGKSISLEEKRLGQKGLEASQFVNHKKYTNEIQNYLNY